MSGADRRGFLRMLGAGAAVSASGGVFPQAIASALSIPASRVTGTIKDVKHVVILMQENRSFDHYFGTLKGVRGFGDRHPVPMTNGPVWKQSDGAREIPPYHLDTKTTNAIAVPGTPHSFSDSQAAWNQGKFGYWPKYKNPYSMGYYKRDDIPFQFALAEAFTICDAYHCSITTGTDPNRIVFWSGANHDPQLRAKGINGTDADSEPNNLRCWIKGALPTPGYTYQGSAFTWPTIPDVLEGAGVSWRIYQDPNDNWTGAMHGGLAFESFRNAKPGSGLYEKGMSNWSLERFAQDVKDGTLPEVSWILPPKDWSEHPSASTPLQGAEFTAGILEALTANPEVWSRTVFFQTFDENDGLFDHMPPPAPPSYTAAGDMAGKSTLDLKGFYFNDKDNKYRVKDDTISGPVRPWGLGPRVPMYVVSPWSRGGWVTSEVFDHTSVGQFLEKRFDVTIPAISPWHRSVCGDLTSAFDFATPNEPAFPKLPDASGSQKAVLAQIHRKRIEPPVAMQALVQEEGSRPSRPLPYDLEVRALVRDAQVGMEFVNSGHKGAVFQVYDRLDLEAIPRRYTVEAGKSLKDVWPTTARGKSYDFWILGPNGFNRTLKGQMSVSEPEVIFKGDPKTGQVSLSLRNRHTAPLTLRLDGSAYGGAAADITLKPGQTVKRSFDATQSGHWYDLSITAQGFERRFAGRLETGKASVSDPLMGGIVEFKTA
ncbi:phosphocholine-specific phospholipase C [Asticcacaulis machinosus]|uniref:phospholipase C n=1 Tax=Asticcacaulis machinosus TaxID=2984211 RepID=A0ABT5HHB9_9CAUL|nr:phospholipase C, phosphocholine-specific [Asticcacaulis machinosus]MDC7675550.1 phospholipase C, phosphocholine-specific [Asticcacaulis machinosus]